MKNLIYRIIDSIMPVKWYIEHTTFDPNGDSERPSYFGPFERYEAAQNINDAYGRFLSSGIDHLLVVPLTWSQARRRGIISDRDFWYEQREIFACDCYSDVENDSGKIVHYKECAVIQETKGY